jgi:hypothetical protein
MPARSAPVPELLPIAHMLPGFDAAASNTIAAPTGAGRGDCPAEPRHQGDPGGCRLPPRLAELGLEPIGCTPEQTAATIREETARWRGVIQAANIRPD